MGELSLALLGTPVVCHDSRELTFPTRKALALLVYLAVEGGRHTREKLVTLFWPESDEVRGRAVLRRSLVLLRQVLDDQAHPVSARHITTEQSFVSLNSASGMEIDVRLLDNLLNTPQSGSRAGRGYDQRSAGSTALLDRLEQVSQLYRGEFLEGFSLRDAPAFDTWLSLHREIWHRKSGLLLEQLSHLQAETGQTAKATATARRHVAHDPFNETAYTNLMRLQLAGGDRMASRQTYERLRSVLSRERG